jgi:hypothetical protein
MGTHRDPISFWVLSKKRAGADGPTRWKMPRALSKKEQGGDAIIVMNHADRADGSVTYANAFGNLNSNTGFVSGSGFAVNIPRRVDKATVMVIKWK